MIYLTLFLFVSQANCNGTVIVLKTQMRNEGILCIVKVPERDVHSRMWDQTQLPELGFLGAGRAPPALRPQLELVSRVKLLRLSKHSLPQAASSGLCLTVNTFQPKFLV